MTGNTITNPIWMVKTRMQLLADGAAGQKAYKGYRDAITRIYRWGGGDGRVVDQIVLVFGGGHNPLT